MINLDLETARCYTTNNTVGVKNIVSCGCNPSVSDSEFITALKTLESSYGLTDTGNNNLGSHQEVEIFFGQLANKIGEVLCLDLINRVTFLFQIYEHGVHVR